MAGRHKKRLWLRALKTKRFWIFIIFVLMLGGLAYIIVFSDFFQMEEIQIKGNEKVKMQDILDIVELKAERALKLGPLKLISSKSLFLINPKSIEQELLARFPEIGGISIKKRIPGILLLEIYEREPFAEICQPSGECFMVDQESVAFEKSTFLKENAGGVKIVEVRQQALTIYLEEEMAVELGKEVVGAGYLRAIDIAFRNLEQELGLSIEKIILTKDGRLDVKTEQGFKIYFNINRDIKDQLFNLELVLREKISAKELLGLEYIDLRFGNRIYYK